MWWALILAVVLGGCVFIFGDYNRVDDESTDDFGVSLEQEVTVPDEPAQLSPPPTVPPASHERTP